MHLIHLHYIFALFLSTFVSVTVVIDLIDSKFDFDSVFSIRTMPLPIAVGGVSLSSERLKGPYQPPPSGLSHGTSTESQHLEPLVPEPLQSQSVTWAVCPQTEWQARTVVSFFDKENVSGGESESETQQQEGKNPKRRRMVEIRLQISPLARALSPKVYRETSYHLELFDYDEDDDGSEIGSNSYGLTDDHIEDSLSSDSETVDGDHLGNQWRQEETHRQPQVVFSQDRRHLMVLLFHNNNQSGNSNIRKRTDFSEKTEQQQSAMIIFQLRKPKTPTISSPDIRSKIPLPSYIAKATPDSSDDSNASGEFTEHRNNAIATNSSNFIGGSPVVATHPKFVPSCKGVTAICRLSGEAINHGCLPPPSFPNPTFCLAVKNDGTLNWVNIHSAKITATAELLGIHSNRCIVSSMKASPDSTLDSGMVALVIAYSNSSSGSDSSQSVVSCVTDYDENDVDDIAGSIESITSNSINSEEYSNCQRMKRGDCVLMKWSNPSRQSPSANNETRSGSPSGMMNVTLRSVWSPPSGIDENDELRVTGVCFGSLPSVLCVVYTHSNEGEVSLGPRQKLAQVLTISNNVSSGSSEVCDLVPTVSLYLSADQVEQAPNVANVDHKMNFNSDKDHDHYEYDTGSCSEYETSMDEVSSDEDSDKRRKENPFGATIESRLVGIQHDPASDSFVVSSIFFGNHEQMDYWVGCVWNWRANAIGWMIQHEIPALPSSYRNNIGRDGICWSRLYFGHDMYNGGGSYLVHMNSFLQYDDIIDDGNPINFENLAFLKTRKRIVPVAMLSPRNSSDPIVFSERSSLLLAENHISFPSVARKDSDVTVRELDWKISALPLSYTASHGPLRIAAMGHTQVKSIAVASARGVCVMDTHHNKWKQFGSPSEERSFSILAMTWWEGSPRSGKDDKRDDLLVAITQTRFDERFLSCWAPKR